MFDEFVSIEYMASTNEVCRRNKEEDATEWTLWADMS